VNNEKEEKKRSTKFCTKLREKMEKLEHNFPAILNEVIKCDIFLAGEKQS